jgi:SAM-dependent methyltransferase
MVPIDRTSTTLITPDSQITRFVARIAAECQQRYRQGEWRAKIFRDLVIGAVQSTGSAAKVLDIGCGHGFDCDMQIQEQIADEAAELIGIEPDGDVQVSHRFTVCHRMPFERAPIEAGSIDVAYAVMVMEHVRNPNEFFEKMHQILRPGGIFWGFTVDRRHYFCAASRLLEALRLKEAYLNRLQGSRGRDRYENYRTYYRCNSPSQVERLTRGFSQVDTFTLSRPGEIDSCYPKSLIPVFRGVDWLIDRLGLPGPLLFVRCQK